jgi:hypothetical protein
MAHGSLDKEEEWINDTSGKLVVEFISGHIKFQPSYIAV